MKKLTKAAALLAATALLFGTVACNSDDGDDSPKTNGSQPVNNGSEPGPSSGGTGGEGTGGSGDSGNTVTTVTYTWDFSNTDLTSVPAWSAYAGSKSTTSGAELLKVNLDADATYESTPAGLTLKMPKDSQYNKVSPAKSSSVTAEGATNGSIELGGDVVGKEFSVSVKGPFTVKMVDGANSSTDKTDRYAFIKVNGEEVVAPNKASNTIPAAGEVLSYSYTGEDTVTVSFGATNIVRIYTITIEAAEIAAGDKVAGKVISLGSFASEQNNATANDRATLGLVGTSVSSSAEGVATVAISDGKIVITSVSAGTATITVTDGTQEATIAVTVGATGAITVGAITKYAPAAPVKDTDYTVEDAKLTAVNAIEYSTDNGENWTALEAGSAYTATESSSVLVRFAEGTYDASPAVTVVLTPSGAPLDLTVYNFTEYFDKYGATADDISTETPSTEKTLAVGERLYFQSGIELVVKTKTGTKIGAKTATYDSYNTKARIALDKSSNGAELVIPVKGNCTIYVGHGNNKSDGTVRALKAVASDTGATVIATNGDNPNTAIYNDASKGGANTVGIFNYTGGEGIITLTTTDASGNAANGSCYIGVVDVAYSND